MTKSALEEIPGIGPSRRRESIKHFKDIESINEAAHENETKTHSLVVTV